MNVTKIVRMDKGPSTTPAPEQISAMPAVCQGADKLLKKYTVVACFDTVVSESTQLSVLTAHLIRLVYLCRVPVQNPYQVPINSPTFLFHPI